MGTRFDVNERKALFNEVSFYLLLYYITLAMHGD